jgi:imidazolonepropionase-like amidohydrolase
MKPQTNAKRIALFAPRVFIGDGGDPIADGGVVFEGDRIVAVGTRRSIEAKAKGARRIDCDDCSLMPGFINLHVHLDFDGGSDFLTAARLMEEQRSTLLAAESARRALESGVTTVRDLGNKFAVGVAVRDAIALGWIPGPRVFAAGHAICMTGGHGWFIGHETDGPHEMRKAVRTNLRLGVDCIKVIASGGVLSPGVEVGSAQLDEDELAVAVREAHKAGKRVAAHAIANAGIKNALRAGVDSIEHGCYLDREAVAMMKRAGTWFVPTLSAPDALREHRDEVPAYVAKKADQVYEAHRESFKLALRHGVRIATGTDAGTPFNTHAGFAREFELMVGLGMPAAAAIGAATSDAAKALGAEDEIGMLAAGMSADIVAVAGDPRRDPQALRRVELVVARGAVRRKGGVDRGSRAIE